jgi:hypothetical protein
MLTEFEAKSLRAIASEFIGQSLGLAALNARTMHSPDISDTFIRNYVITYERNANEANQ